MGLQIICKPCLSKDKKGNRKCDMEHSTGYQVTLNAMLVHKVVRYTKIDIRHNSLQPRKQ